MPKMKKLSEKAEKIISEMKKAGWLEADYYPGIYLVMYRDGETKTITKSGTVRDGNMGPQ